MERVCHTCEHSLNDICRILSYRVKLGEESSKCSGWEASTKYYYEILNRASWYIKNDYAHCRITHNQLFEQVEADVNGEEIEINLYDAIEEIYGLNSTKLAEFLGVSVGTINYARSRHTPERRVKEFSEKLCIPTSYFDRFTSYDLGEFNKCRESFYSRNRQFL